jgi:hypothetical protein
MHHVIPQPGAQSQPIEPEDKKRRMIALAKAMKAHTKKPLGGMKEDSLKAGKRYA